MGASSVRKSKKRKKDFMIAFKESKGIITYACDAIGVSRQTFYYWMSTDEKFKQEIDDINESTIDLVEHKLLSLINKEDTTAIIFYLKTKGRNRGYIERYEQEITSHPFTELMKRASQTEETEE